MSDVKRYTSVGIMGFGDGTHEDENGNYVRYEEYARLKAEVERLTIERNGFEQAMKANQSILETKRDEVERLRKAGDAMASSIQFNEEMAKDYNGPTVVHQCVKAWIAAKEGRPNE